MDKHHISKASAEEKATKSNAKDSIRNLCEAIKQRIGLLLYAKDIISDFDWDRYHHFEAYKEESNEKVVHQELQKREIIIGFKYQRDMDNFIFTNLFTFFSTLTAIVDNLAIILKSSFNLNMEGKTTTIVRVQKKMPDCRLKDELYKGIISNKDFTGILNVRNACEHRDYTQVFLFSDTPRREAIGSEPSGIPLIREDLLVNTEGPIERQVNNYCEFAYAKLYSFLKLFLTIVMTSPEMCN